MEKYEVIFCVLTYKNHIDLIEFIKSASICKFSYKIIVINNYADDESIIKIKFAAITNNCAYIEKENKGYGCGNNVGITYALKNYKFNYLVICNPDTIIINFKFESLVGAEKQITAPEIICKNGKKQNPAFFFYNPIVEKIIAIGLNRNKIYLYYIAVAVNKFLRIIQSYFSRTKKKIIYMCHGSFIIFSYHSIKILSPVFDQNIFLFAEEYDLAKSAKNKNIEIVYNKDIIIFHKEDGSIRLSHVNVLNTIKKSFIYYYRKWYK